MPKNIVLCCDGTSNEFGTTNTNVVHLFTTLVRRSGVQVAYYHPGLGTMGAPGAWTRAEQVVSKLLGLAFGRGLRDDIRDAYVYLMRNYEVEDRIFLFGFSRGAYTVRALAGLLHMFGLIRSGNEPLVPYAIEMLTNLTSRSFEVAREFKATFSIDYRSRIQRRWLWILICLLGAPDTTMNWSTGEVRTRTLSVLLVSAGFLKPGPNAPWFVDVAFPLGAFPFLSRRKKLLAAARPLLADDQLQ